jgi:hypothetical protein
VDGFPECCSQWDVFRDEGIAKKMQGRLKRRHAGQGEGSLSLSLHLVLLLVGLGIDVASRARHASASSGELVVEHGGGGTEGNARRGNVGGGSRRHAPRVDAQRCPADGGADSEHSLCRGVV